jgi:hypothetical protein
VKKKNAERGAERCSGRLREAERCSGRLRKTTHFNEGEKRGAKPWGDLFKMCVCVYTHTQ